MIKTSTCGTQHTTKGHTSMTLLNHPSIYHEQSLTLNMVALIFLFKAKSSPFSLTMPNLTTSITSQHLWKWNMLHLLCDWTDYLAFGIMPYTTWAFGYVQQAHSEQQQFLVESTQLSLTTTTSVKWLICWWNCFGKYCDSFGFGLWMGTALPWQGICQW